MTTVHTPAEVADYFKITRDQVSRKAMDSLWPHLRIGKRTIRFTDQHIAQIEAIISIEPTRTVISLNGRRGRSSR